MARNDFDIMNAASSPSGTGNPFDPQIRAGLRLAFPLPAMREGADDRLLRLLDALGRHGWAAS